jgi:hypothetical protein
VAKLRQANIDASAGAREELARIVARLRKAWPDVEIWIRADSGFARDELMSWCEENRVEYVLGLARNKRLEPMIAAELAEAKATFEATGKAARIFKELTAVSSSPSPAPARPRRSSHSPWNDSGTCASLQPPSRPDRRPARPRINRRGSAPSLPKPPRRLLPARPPPEILRRLRIAKGVGPN